MTEFEKLLSKYELKEDTKELFTDIYKNLSTSNQDAMAKSKEAVIKSRELTKALFGKEDITKCTTAEVEAVKATITQPKTENLDVEVKKAKEDGTYGGFLLAFASANGDIEKAKQIVKNWKENPFKYDSSKNIVNIEKAINSTSINEGGAFTETSFNDFAIKFLFNREVMDKLGLMRVQMDGVAEEKFGRLNSGFIPLNFQEGQKIKKGTIKTGELFLKPKYRGGILPVQVQWINTARPAAMQYMQENMISGMKQVREQDFFTGTGISGQPRGLETLVKAGNKFDSDGTTNANIISDSAKFLIKLEDNNIDINAGATVMRGRRAEYLKSLRDEAGWIFREEMLLGKFNGYNYYATNNCSSDKVYFADFSKIMEGSNQKLSVEMFNEGSYDDLSGTTRSLLQEYQKALRIVMSYDFAAMYDGAIAIMEGVTWGD